MNMLNRKVAHVGLVAAVLLAGAAQACSSDSATTATTPDAGGEVDSGGGVDASGPVDSGGGADSGGGSDSAKGDSGGGSDAAAEADAEPAWTPATLGASLAMWLDGDKGVTTVNCTTNQCVTTWADQTSNHNNAVQATPTARPQYDVAKYNGHNAIKYDGSTTTLNVPDSASLQFSGGYTLIAVVANAVTASPHSGAIYSKQAAAYPFIGPSLWLNYTNTNGVPQMAQSGTQTDYTQFIATTQTALDDNALRAYEARWDSTAASNQLSLRVNNGAPQLANATETGGLIEAAGVDVSIGGKPDLGPGAEWRDRGSHRDQQSDHRRRGGQRVCVSQGEVQPALRRTRERATTPPRSTRAPPTHGKCEARGMCK